MNTFYKLFIDLKEHSNLKYFIGIKAKLLHLNNYFLERMIHTKADPCTFFHLGKGYLRLIVQIPKEFNVSDKTETILSHKHSEASLVHVFFYHTKPGIAIEIKCIIYEYFQNRHCLKSLHCVLYFTLPLIQISCYLNS